MLLHPGVLSSSVQMALDTEACECPNTLVQAERLMATSGHLFEDMTATCHPPGTPEEFNGKSSHIQGPSDSSRRNSVELPQQCAHGLRHSDGRFGEPRGPALRSSTRILFVHHVALTLACHCLGQGQAANMIWTSRPVYVKMDFGF